MNTSLKQIEDLKIIRKCEMIICSYNYNEQHKLVEEYRTKESLLIFVEEYDLIRELKPFNLQIQNELSKDNVFEVIDFIARNKWVPETVDEMINYKKLMEI